MNVEDIKSFMFTYGKKMLDNHIVSSERFLMYAGSKFCASEHLSLEHGDVIIHNIVKPAEIQSQTEYDSILI